MDNLAILPSGVCLRVSVDGTLLYCVAATYLKVAGEVWHDLVRGSLRIARWTWL